MRFLDVISKRFSPKDLFIEILYISFGYILLLLSYLSKRDKHIWVFGNKELFKDNTKYLYIYLLNNHVEISPIWITSSHDLVAEMKAKGFPVYHKYSIKGLYYSLVAGVYVSTVNSNHINYFTSGGSFKVYLWHGIALKSMTESKSTPADGSLLSRICMPYAYEKIDFFLSTTPMIDDQFIRTFHLSPEVLYHGMYPRCSFMLSPKKELVDYIKSNETPLMNKIIEKINNYSKIYIYMPTWRINLGTDFLRYSIPDLPKLNQILYKHNALFLLKLHPSMHYNPFKDGDLNNILYIEAGIDLYPILPFTDVLITDYSSIYYDYLLLENKGAILYDFDYENYVKNEFNLFRNYKQYTPGYHVDTFEKLLSIIDSDNSLDIPQKERAWVLNEMWGNYQDKSSEDLVEEIKKRIGLQHE